jgi:NhaP-type Na+/H+ or K+/H+ antiporter
LIDCFTGEELFKVSGVLAVVVLGVRMSAEKTMISNSQC